jgi:hypothetical protein
MKVKVLFYLTINLFFINSSFFPQSKLISPENLTNPVTQNLILPKYLQDDLKLNYSTKENQTNSTLDSIYMITLGGTLTKVDFYFNTQSKLTSYIHSLWDGNKWIIDWRVTNSYNSNGKIQTHLLEDLNSNSWIPYSRENYNYDSLVHNTSYLLEYWFGTQWVYSSMSTEKYDTTGNLIEEIIETWVDTSWIYYLRITRTYHEKDILASILIENWDNNNWIFKDKINYEYDSHWNLTNSIIKEWNGSEWLNIARGSFCYDLNNNRTEQIIETWVDSNWIYDDRILNEYNDNNYKVHSKYFYWDKGAWQSAAIGLIVFTIPESTTMGFITSEINFFYSNPTDVPSKNNSVINNYFLSQNFPNPFNPATKIRYQIPSAKFVSLKIFDILGNEVTALVNEYKQQGIYEVEFNTRRGEVTSPLPSGIYFYQLKAGDYVETKKLVLMK